MSLSDSANATEDRRKLIAVVYADMVGYSRLIGLDDVGTLQRLRMLRNEVINPAINQHGGRTVQTGGDSLLILFDSIDGAVRCAVRIQQQTPDHDAGNLPDRSIRFRIGIDIGDVIADGTDFHGDGVIVAARLQAECPPGGICVSRAVRDHVHDRLDLTFEPLGALHLKNISRPVEAFVLRSDAPRVPGAGDPVPIRDKPSIAVLAFANMSGDPEQEYFADGVADDIITELSRIRSLLVIARSTSFTYKGHTVDVRQVARELGVRYVLEGSVRRSRGRVRIGAQLVDATTADHIWAERYDRDVADIFAVQDEITAAVTGAIGPAIMDAEQRRATRKPPASLNAWEAYLRGQWHEGLGTPADHEQAKQFFQRAIALDATFPAPYVALARAFVDDAPAFGTRSPENAAAVSASWAQKAIAIDPEDADARAMVALAAQVAGNADAARDQIQLAHNCNPNSPMVLAVQGNILLFLGQPALARQALMACLRLDPRGPLCRRVMHQLAVSYYYERDYAEAVEAQRRTVARYPNTYAAYRWLAAALGQLGRTEEARVTLQKALELSPQAFEFYTSRRPPWHRPEDYEHMLDGLRKAGWQG
jgi:adenylate cyclase